MTVDQTEIDALLAQAGELAADARVAVVDRPPAIDPPRGGAAPSASRAQVGSPSTLKRVGRLRVPVIVQLATRQMPIAAVRDISIGSIIEFEKAVEDPLDLLVNNRLIGHGICVKVGENFGLRITEIVSKSDRVRSLG